MLRKASFPFTESELIAVELPKRKNHTLIAICSAPYCRRRSIFIMPIHFSPGRAGLHWPCTWTDPTLAAQLLIRKGFTLIAESDLKG